jgi:succinoglycan biosynthesis transport protein ExoP
MEEEVKGLADYLDIIRRHKYLVIIPAVILSIISAAVIYSLPATYRSEGLILIESQEIPSDLVKSTVTSYADQRIEVIKQKIMTTAKVMAMVKKYQLYPDLRKNQPVSAIVGVFRQNIQVKMVDANVTDPRSGRSSRSNIAFTVSFMDKSAQLAQKVANDLVTEFLNENARTRTDRAAETTKFLQEESNRFERKVQLLEKKIAEFKDKYSDSLPELLQYNLSMVERLQQELADNQNQIMVLKDQIMTMSLEMVNIQPYLDSQNRLSLAEEKVTTAEQQLLQVKAEYSRLSAKYSGNHPNVQQLKRQIDSLESDLGIDTSEVDRLTMALGLATEDLNNLKQRYSASHPDVKVRQKQVQDLEVELSQAESQAKQTQKKDTKSATQKNQLMSPVYLQIKSKIDSSEREIIRLQSRQTEVNEKLADYEQRVVKTHQVKRAYDDLTRDYENNSAKYKELRAKQLEAELAQNLETENKGESFTLIEPPRVPSKAEKPNRPKLLAMGVAVSVGTGFGLAILVEMLFGGLRGYNQISRVLGAAPLVVVPIIATLQDMQAKRSSRIKIIILIMLLFILSIAGFHIWVMDLEVLWFKVMRKISAL